MEIYDPKLDPKTQEEFKIFLIKLGITPTSETPQILDSMFTLYLKMGNKNNKPNSMEIILEPEVLEVLIRFAKLDNIAPEEFVEKIVKEFLAGKIHYGTSGEAHRSSPSSFWIIGDCTHPPSSGNDTISQALQVACSISGVVKSAQYHKSETSIALEIQFEETVVHTDKKKGIAERMKSFKAEWTLEPIKSEPGVP